MRELTTASEVIDALGGTMATARLIPASIAAVSNWRTYGRLPAHTYLIVRKKLASLGLEAPSSLWGITAPEQVA